MRKEFTSQKILGLSFQSCLIALVALTLPFYGKVNPASIVVLTLWWFVDGNFKNKIERLKKNSIVFLIIGFYLLSVLSLLYTSNLKLGLFELEQKASLLVLPLVISSLSPISRKEMIFILSAFVISCLSVDSYLLANALYEYNYLSNEGAFGHPEFSKNTPIHLSYLSMYLIMSFCILYYFWEIGSNEMSTTLKMGVAASIVFIFCSVIILTARTSMVVMILVAMLLSARILFFRFGYKGLFLVILIPILAGLIFQNFSRVQQRVISSSKKDFLDRMDVWNCGWQTGMNNFFVGVGPGDKAELIASCYKENGMTAQYDESYNCHSEYLEIFATLGIVGFLIFAGSLIAPFFVNNGNGVALYSFYFIVIGMCMATESILELRIGVVFFSLFYSLLTFHRFD